MSNHPSNKQERRRYRSSPVGDLIQQVTKKAGQKRGFAEARLLTEWHTIIGTELASRCIPDKMVYTSKKHQIGTLHLKCDPAFAPELPYLEPIILEKIATFFGYRAVDRLVIHPHSMKETEKHPGTKAPKPTHKNTQPIDLDNITDEDLKEALQRLATARQSET